MSQGSKKTCHAFPSMLDERQTDFAIEICLFRWVWAVVFQVSAADWSHAFDLSSDVFTGCFGVCSTILSDIRLMKSPSGEMT